MADLENLYHVKRTITDYAEDKSGATRTVDILGTYVSLEAAKKAARNGLKDEGYLPDDFDIYEEKSNAENWTHGDGVLVYARAPAGQEFFVRLDTKPNVSGYQGNAEGRVQDEPYYVLQTRIDYNNDRIGGLQSTEVEGTYGNQAKAIEAAKKTLLDENEGVTKEWFAEYDEKPEDDGEWEYGDDVYVRAVGPNGENFTVAVKTEKVKIAKQ